MFVRWICVVFCLAWTVPAQAQSCCDKAESAGKTCAHPCCVKAYAVGMVCFNCNPDKTKSCCDKAFEAQKPCSHPCCAQEAEVLSVCFKCNPNGTAVPFRGADLAVFKPKSKAKNKWVTGEPGLDPAKAELLKVAGTKGAFVNEVHEHGQGSDLFTKAKFGDCRIQIDVMVAKGSNSGIYVMGEYEVQVLDSFGKTEMGMGDMGALYGAAPPSTNATKAPGEWQRFVIDFRAPRFENGKKTANARFLQVSLNGTVVQKNAEMKGPTPGGLTGKETPKGPLMFQGDHGPVAYKNLRVSKLPKTAAASG